MLEVMPGGRTGRGHVRGFPVEFEMPTVAIVLSDPASTTTLGIVAAGQGCYPTC